MNNMENIDDKTIVIRTDETGIEAPTPPEKTPDNPEKIFASKFRTPEELEQAYLELQKKLGERQEDKTPDETKPEDNKPPEENKGEDQKFIVAGQDVSKFSKMYMETGELDDEAYTELEKMGFPKAAVDAYLAGQAVPRTIAEEEVKAVKAVAGGDEGYSKLVTWASTNLSPQEIAAFNKAVDTGDRDIAIMAVEKLQAKYELAYGRQPELISGKPTDTRSAGFRSTAEVTAAMKDPRYKSDPAYRDDVAKRLAASSVF